VPRIKRSVHARKKRRKALEQAKGYVEALGLTRDVIVTDGFTGNVLLKGVEAALAAAPGSFPPTSVPRAAALLGVARTIVVCHGAASAEDVASGLALAARLVRADVVARLAAAAGFGATQVEPVRPAEVSP